MVYLLALCLTESLIFHFFQTFLYDHLDWGDSVISQPFPQLFIIVHAGKRFKALLFIPGSEIILLSIHSLHYPFCTFAKYKPS